MLRESDAWKEKSLSKRLSKMAVVQKSSNPFEALKSAYSVDDDCVLEQVMQRLSEYGVDGLEQEYCDFVLHLEDAKEKMCVSYHLSAAKLTLVNHICERAVSEVRSVLHQVQELSASDDNDKEDILKAAFFFHMTLGTTVEMVCSLVNEEVFNK